MKDYNYVSSYLDVQKKKVNKAVSTQRLDAFPLDYYSVFGTLNAASAYAATNAAYEGQVVAVRDGGRQVLYVLDTADDVSATGLRRVGVISADELCGISDYAKAADLAVVSGAVEKKIWVEDRISSVSAYGDLSVVQLPMDEFGEFVAKTGGQLASNTLYIPYGEYINAFGQEIRNLSTPGVPGYSEAANVSCVSSMIQQHTPKFSDLSNDSAISGLLSVVGAEGIGGVELANAVSALVNLCWRLIRGV